MKTSIFGDQDFVRELNEAGHHGMLPVLMYAGAWILLVSACVLAFLCLYATVRVLISKEYITDGAYRLFFAAVYAVSMAAYISFMMKATYYSSMDFRYVLYLIPVEALMLGLYFGKSGRVFRVAAAVGVLLFSVSSVGVYMTLLCFT